MAGRYDCGPHDNNEVGRILLGDRVFRILPASALPGLPAGGARAGEGCRFELGGRALVALEVAARPDPDTPDPDAPDPDNPAAELAARLTGRELEIAVLVAQGHATKNIAYRLRISEWTVATYLRRIFAKLNVDSRAAMVFRCAPLITASLAPAPPTGAPRHRPARHD